MRALGDSFAVALGGLVFWSFVWSNFVGCGAGFWADDPNSPTDLVHDPLQGGTMNNSSQEHPMFMHGDAMVFQSYDAGAVDVDASIGAAKAVLDAVVTP